MPGAISLERAGVGVTTEYSIITSSPVYTAPASPTYTTSPPSPPLTILTNMKQSKGSCEKEFAITFIVYCLQTILEDKFSLLSVAISISSKSCLSGVCWSHSNQLEKHFDNKLSQNYLNSHLREFLILLNCSFFLTLSEFVVFTS